MKFDIASYGPEHIELISLSLYWSRFYLKDPQTIANTHITLKINWLFLDTLARVQNFAKKIQKNVLEITKQSRHYTKAPKRPINLS